jgi:endonuclease/exonuclease/phosphatase family metal-dependent hydrolase
VEILTWNIQAGLGVDGRVDLGRIAHVARQFCDADVICFQEVSRYMRIFESSVADDQVAALAGSFPDHQAFFGPVIDAIGEQGKRQQFGNLVLCRPPVVACSRHLLPRPACPGVRHMRRQATELLVDGGGGLLRIISTHLEYFAGVQRSAQVSRLLELHQESCANARQPPLASRIGPYVHVPRPSAAVLCGDFNFRVQDPEYAVITSFADAQTPRLADSWRIVHGDRPHDPTCGIFDANQWPEGPHCRDFFFASEDIASHIKGLRVDAQTAASDHQPLSLSIGF